MLPAFNDDGYLPPGIHQATLDEAEARFGAKPSCVVCRWSRCAGSSIWRDGPALRLIVNGSFVTHRPEPNDVDCVLLIGPGFPHDADAENELLDGLPFIELKMVAAEDFTLLVERIFASDRQAVPKGMIEVEL